MVLIPEINPVIFHMGCAFYSVWPSSYVELHCVQKWCFVAFQHVASAQNMFSSKYQQLHLYAATVMIQAEIFQRILGWYLRKLCLLSPLGAVTLLTFPLLSSHLVNCAHNPTILMLLYLVKHTSAKLAAHRRSAQFIRTTTKCEASVLCDWSCVKHCVHVQRQELFSGRDRWLCTNTIHTQTLS